MDARKILNHLSKEELIDLVVEYSRLGFFPLEPFLLQTNYVFSPDELQELWQSAYEKARQYEDQKSELGADLLKDIAELCFEHAIKLKERDSRSEVLHMLIDDLIKANEEDGIGMYYDSEWFYGEVREKIEAYLGISTR